MSLFSSKENSPHNVAVFDIGSGNVGVAIVRVGGESDRPVFLFSQRFEIAIEEEVNFEKFAISMASALELAAKAVRDAKVSGISEVFCFLGSPWYASQTRTISFTKNNPFNVTESLIKNLVDKEIDLFKKGDLPKYASYEKMSILENYTIDCILNGYRVPNPFQKNVSSVNLSIFLSMSPSIILDQMKKIIERHVSFAHRKLFFASTVFSEYLLISNLFVKNDSYLLIDVDGEITDISVVKNNVLEETMSFPVGRNALVRDITTCKHNTQAEATTLIRGYISGHLELTVHEEIEECLSRVRTTWLDSFQDSLTRLAGHLALPRTVFLVTESDIAPWFTDTIKREEFSQYMLTDRRFSVIPLSAPSINEYCDFASNVVDREYDLMIHALYISRVIHHIKTNNN